MTAAEEAAAAGMDGDIVPMMEAGEDGGVCFRVRGAEVLHGLIGEHHSPAESVVRSVPLVYFDSDRRQRFAKQNGSVQSGRAAPQAYDSLHGHVILPSTSGV